MKNNIELSYIISTKNRLPFLKITLTMLIAELRPGEEIVVVDGNSNDGSKEYLQTLFDANQIHYYISEPDKNQAHGWNKAILAAKGLVIKKIIDDDVFDYPSIRTCKDYLIANPEIDVVISNDLSCHIVTHQNIEYHSRLKYFLEWREKKVPSFTFGDVHLLIRRSSLAYIGLYNTSYTMMDWEYSLKISFLNAKIAFYTGYNALSISHPDTITANSNPMKYLDETKRANIFYKYKGDYAQLSAWSKIKIFIGKKLMAKAISSPSLPQITNSEQEKIYKELYKEINKINNAISTEFIA